MGASRHPAGRPCRRGPARASPARDRRPRADRAAAHKRSVASMESGVRVRSGRFRQARAGRNGGLELGSRGEAAGAGRQAARGAVPEAWAGGEIAKPPCGAWRMLGVHDGRPPSPSIAAVAVQIKTIERTLYSVRPSHFQKNTPALGRKLRSRGRGKGDSPCRTSHCRRNDDVARRPHASRSRMASAKRLGASCGAL